jgi:hypothetical protein
MKKQKYIIYIKALLLALSICLYSETLRAQNNQTVKSATQDSATVNPIAKRIANSRKMAIEQAFNNEGVKQLMKDSTLSSQQKLQQLKSILAQRRQLLSTILSKEEKAQLNQTGNANLQDRNNAIVQRHQQQLDRTPHQQSQTIPIDVLKPAKLPSSKK